MLERGEAIGLLAILAVLLAATLYVAVRRTPSFGVVFALRSAPTVAHTDIVLLADGRADIAVLRPDTDAVVHETARVHSVDAFGVLVDRVVELITWSGVRPDQVDGTPQGQRSAVWVLAHGSNPLT